MACYRDSFTFFTSVVLQVHEIKGWDLYFVGLLKTNFVSEIRLYLCGVCLLWQKTSRAVSWKIPPCGRLFFSSSSFFFFFFAIRALKKGARVAFVLPSGR
jgi:hypothetical protein